MSVRALLTQPLNVHPVGSTGTDDYGNEIRGDMGDPIPELGFLELKDTIEYVNDRQTTVSRWHATLLPESVVTALAYITYAGQTFQVDGEPWHVYNPRTRMVSHIECKLIEIS